MKKLKKLASVLTAVLFLIGSASVFSAKANAEVSASSGSQPITIDGSFSDWNNLPYSYEYNWDNPYIYENQWNPVTKKNETVVYKDENGQPYNTQIRHKMSLYRDDKYVYVHIIIAANYSSGFNGADYEFYCDGQLARFQVVKQNGKQISANSFGAGIYPVAVQHDDGAISGQMSRDSQAILKRNANGINDEIEFKIPFSEFQRQNKNIDPQNIRQLDLYDPNLMYRHIICAGTDTAPYIGIGVCAVIAGGGYLFYNKKRKTTV